MKTKTLKLILEDYGSFLGKAEGCFELRNEKGKIERFPYFQKEISEAVLKSGSYISVDALIDLALWNIDTLIITRHNRVVAILKNLEDDSHVKTRISQYEALKNEKGKQIAKQIVLSKLEGQNQVLKKYSLRKHDYSVAEKIKNLDSSDTKLRTKLMSIEGHYSENYFNQIFSLLPASYRPESRKTFKAYDGINNVFNFGYYILKCRIHKALLKAKLEPYLGFLHSVQAGKPSLILDFQELYRYLIDDYLIERCKKLHKNDFVLVTDCQMRLRMGKKIHLCEFETNDLAEGLNSLFERTVEISRIRYGSKQKLDTLISEEAYLFAQYLRNERESWNPRIVNISM